MKMLNHEQGSEEWFAARHGIPTGSKFSKIVTAAKGEKSKSSVAYIAELLAEVYCPDETKEGFHSDEMDHGNEYEPIAARWYGHEFDCEPEEVGLCLTDCERAGASPDRLIGDDGVLEIKCPAGRTHIGWSAAGVLPAKHKAQVHGHMYVTGRDWCDFLSYHKILGAWKVRVYRDEFTENLGESVMSFCDDLDEAAAKLEQAMEAQGLPIPGRALA